MDHSISHEGVTEFPAKLGAKNTFPSRVLFSKVNLDYYNAAWKNSS